MSGGSYDYFYYNCPDKLNEFADQLEDMAKRCEEGATRPPEKHWKTGEMIDMSGLLEAAGYLRALAMRMRGMAKTMEAWADLPSAVEWWTSGDSGPINVIEAVAKLKAGIK